MEIRPVLQSKQKYSLRTNLTPQLIGRVKLADFMELPERAFSKFVIKLENDPLFKRLVYPRKKEEKIISYKKLYRTGLSLRFLELKDELVTDKSSFDIQHLLAGQQKVVQIIKKLGVDKFKQYFLYNKADMTNGEVSALCGLGIDSVKSINAFMDNLSIHCEFYYPSQICSEEGIKYSKIASIKKNNKEGFIINYLSPHLAKGKYLINYEKLNRLKNECVFSEKEAKRIDRLLKQLEVINSRKTTIYEVIQNIIKCQSDFLRTGRVDKLVPLYQKESSSRINVDPSLVCRAIQGRSIETPWREEMPLRKFFPSKKDVRKNLVKDIILTEKQPYTDVEIKNLLKKRYRVDVSAHLVNICRNELKIPCAGKRNKG